MSIFSRRYRGAAAEPQSTEPVRKPFSPQDFEHQHQGQSENGLTQEQIDNGLQVIDQQQQSFAATPEARKTQQLQAGKERYRPEAAAMQQPAEQPGATVQAGQQGAQQDVSTPIQEEIESKLAAKDAGTLVDQSDEQQEGYLADWSNGFDKGLHWLWREQGQQAKPTEVIQDYNRWAKANGQEPLDAFTMYPFLTRYDPTKSIGEAEAEERRRKRQEKWEQIGNVLSHVGNFIGTALGAPSQQLETGTQLTERQKKLRDATLQQRRQSAIDMLAQLNKDRADARAAETLASNERYRQSLMENNRLKIEQQAFKNQMDADYKKATLAQKEKMLEIRQKLADGRISLMEAQEQLAKVKTQQGGLAPRSGSSGRGGGGSKDTTDYDAEYYRLQNEDPDGMATADTNAGISTSASGKRKGLNASSRKAAVKSYRANKQGNSGKGRHIGDRVQFKK